MPAHHVNDPLVSLSVAAPSLLRNSELTAKGTSFPLNRINQCRATDDAVAIFTKFGTPSDITINCELATTRQAPI
jgi:hypothetical protein